MKPILAAVCMLGMAFAGYAQQTQTDTAKVAAKADSTQKKEAAKPDEKPNGPKPYREVITDKAISTHGLFGVHRIDKRYFFEIPDSLLTLDILVVNRISKAAAGLRPRINAYAGDQIGENVIRFEKGPADRLYIKRLVFVDKSTDSTDNGMYRSVALSNLQPIVAGFDIKAYGGSDSTKKNTSVIDITDFLQSETELFYFSPQSKKALSIGSFQADKSYVDSIRTYPVNVEIRTVRSYQHVSSDPNNPASTMPTTYELNSSLVLLPKTPMKPRLYDERVGFFGRGITDFDTDPHGTRQLGYITRWRLEPKEKDRERYLRGEPVEPAKPIIFYIDPATPKKWVPYLIAGVNDWQGAFEQAGFKNAIKALPAPENDPTWNMEDARHSVIVYKPSAIANASGPHVHDPRSGEIMESHINWYHNIMRVLRSWYMIQAGAIDPRARKAQFDDELMGQLIRFVSSHEVGHTLGLRHNYGSSSTVPVEKLRDREWLEKYGHTPSIMDYARFNYVAQPEDNVTPAGIFPRIGDYDKWAIEWGYRWLPQFNTAEAEKVYSNKLIIERTKNNPRLFFGNEMLPADPRSQSEDLGDDPVLASTYGIKNLQRVLPELPKWTYEPNEGYETLRSIYIDLLRQYNLYGAHVLKVVGGVYYTPKSVEQPGPVTEPVEYEKQKAAMKFLTENIFHLPEWLTNDTLKHYTGISPEMFAGAFQGEALHRLLGSNILQTCIQNQYHTQSKQYGIFEFLDDLKQGVWSELYSDKVIGIHRRNLQKLYIQHAFAAFKATTELVVKNNGNGMIFYANPDPTLMDVSSTIRAHLLTLKDEMNKKINRTDDALTKYHLQDMVYRINKALEVKE